jgi:hypothetical protein
MKPTHEIDIMELAEFAHIIKSVTRMLWAMFPFIYMMLIIVYIMDILPVSFLWLYIPVYCMITSGAYACFARTKTHKINKS